jgi:hypothetical protein
MATRRRGRGGGGRGGGGSRGEELRGTLGSLIRTTIDQMGAVREAVERQARTQRVWIDGALLQRKYREALAQLGEAVYALVAEGELAELADHPELGPRLDEVQALDERLTDAEDRVREATAAARDTAERIAARAGLPTGMLGRPRRRRDEEAGERPRSVGVWRPPVDEEDELDDDGTVAAVTRPKKPAAVRKPRGGGGISFAADEDDGDLADYMHPDDVPDDEGGGQKK